jgi:cysteinyl-tRNA synthetase
MSEISLYNTRTRKKERFEPIDPASVRMYVCGPTVYDRAHIGNARPVVVFDVLYRLLRHVYGEGAVTYVRNITDVDDKINARAAETGRAIRDITEETVAWYREDMDALGALRPTHEPRATEFVPQMVAMIEALIARGHAYAAEGHVLFAVGSYPEYGRFARRSLDEMRAGARVEVAPYKRDPMDFVLWKPSDEGLPGWESPWGRGRPGWHIECSAMSHALLGGSFDIHGGGIDLMFPHHENEIAQSRCAHPGEDFARVWMHNGFLQVEGEKMSKSLGNFFTVRDLLDRGVPGEVIRFVLLSTHYRQPLDWTEAKVEEATRTLEKWRRLIGTGPWLVSPTVPAEIVAALGEDLNTPKALMFLNRLGSEGRVAELNAAARLLGILEPELGHWFQEPELPQDLQAMINFLAIFRHAAKKERDFLKADQIRDDLSRVGIALVDTRDGWNVHYDLLGSAKPIEERLSEALHADSTVFQMTKDDIEQHGFHVDVVSINNKEEVALRVGRSDEERAYLQEVVRQEVNRIFQRYLDAM